jgi:hypothetical protein
MRTNHTQQQTSQTRWNVTTPAQHASSFNTMPYAGVTPTANMSGAVGHYMHRDQPSAMANPHTPAAQGQWQQSNRLPQLIEPQNVNLQQQQQIQHATQFRYHPTSESYQSQTSS